MRDASNIREVETLNPDWMGFIFWQHSSRYVSLPPAYLPTKCKRVGVFVDEDIATVMRFADDYALDIIQLHGHESPEYVRRLHEWKVIKAFNIATVADFCQVQAYEGIVDYFLFDTKSKSVGGNGEKFDWSLLTAYDSQTPFLLSGGIGPDDAPRLHQAFALNGFPVEKCIGIDLNSCFEIAPALKNVELLRRFINDLNSKL